MSTTSGFDRLRPNSGERANDLRTLYRADLAVGAVLSRMDFSEFISKGEGGGEERPLARKSAARNENALMCGLALKKAHSRPT